MKDYHPGEHRMREKIGELSVSGFALLRSAIRGELGPASCATSHIEAVGVISASQIRLAQQYDQQR